MRKALERIAQLYQTSPLFQDLLETSAGTGIATAGQALMTDMTPEELALSSAATFGAGMIGRPLLGRAGQALGTKLDKEIPVLGEGMMEGMEEFLNMMPSGVEKLYRAKMAPYADLGGAAQYLNLMGRGYGDNLAQFGVALAAPGVFDGTQEEKENAL